MPDRSPRSGLPAVDELGAALYAAALAADRREAAQRTDEQGGAQHPRRSRAATTAMLAVSAVVAALALTGAFGGAGNGVGTEAASISVPRQVSSTLAISDMTRLRAQLAGGFGSVPAPLAQLRRTVAQPLPAAAPSTVKAPAALAPGGPRLLTYGAPLSWLVQ